MAVQQIVLIDDDPSWLRPVVELLRLEGFEVETDEDGERGAADCFEATQPLMVILDAHLPRLGGLEILREVRQTDTDLPILLVSADDQSALISQAMGAGASGFLRKPVAAGLLLKAIRRLTGAIPIDDTPTPGSS